MAATYIAWAADTSAVTGPPSFVASSATANTVKTILQIKPTVDIQIIAWGYTLDAAPAANVKVELVETGTVFATVTTLGSGIRNYSNATGASSSASVGTSATGFNASAEGTVTASRLLDYQWENGLYFKQQYPLGREPQVPANRSLRIRVAPSTAASINIMPWIAWEE